LEETWLLIRETCLLVVVSMIASVFSKSSRSKK
jgi:hypothetical protein